MPTTTIVYIGRNDPCPCGSGRKFRRCCIGRDDPTPVPPPRFAPYVDASPREEPLTPHERQIGDRLREELRTFPAAITEVVVGRLTDLTIAPMDRLIDRAARFLADDRALDAKLAAMREGPRLVCRLLAARSFTRGDLVRLLSLRGIDEPGIAISEACQQFPIVWSQGARVDLDRLCTLRVVADRVAARARVPREVRWTEGADLVEKRSAVASLWHALVCAPGALLRARVRINRDGTLHAAAMAKLERALPHAALAVAAWTSVGAVLGGDVAELDLHRCAPARNRRERYSGRLSHHAIGASSGCSTSCVQRHGARTCLSATRWSRSRLRHVGRPTTSSHWLFG